MIQEQHCPSKLEFRGRRISQFLNIANAPTTPERVTRCHACATRSSALAEMIARRPRRKQWCAFRKSQSKASSQAMSSSGRRGSADSGSADLEIASATAAPCRLPSAKRRSDRAFLEAGSGGRKAHILRPVIKHATHRESMHLMLV